MKTKLNVQAIPIEKIIYLAMIIFNFLAIVMLFDYSNFIEAMLSADVILIALIKFERIATFYITVSRASNKK